MSTKISVVVPCFNEAAVLPLLYERLNALEVSPDIELEFILIDDGSSDSTWQQISAIANSRSQWKGIRLARNFGHQNALWMGLQNISGDAAFVIDADLQDPPELISQFIEAWQSGNEVVYGVRKKRKESLWKRLAYTAFYRLLSKVSDIEIPLDAGDFCLMDRKVVDAMLLAETSTPFVRGARAWVGFRQTALEYEREARAAGTEKYHLSHLFDLAINGLISYSRKPIRFILAIGVLLLLFVFMGSVLCISTYVVSGSLLGWTAPWLIGGGVAVLLTGMQLTAIGIVGEYVARIFESKERRPVAIICEVIDSDRDSSENRDILSMNGFHFTNRTSRQSDSARKAA